MDTKKENKLRLKMALVDISDAAKALVDAEQAFMDEQENNPSTIFASLWEASKELDIFKFEDPYQKLQNMGITVKFNNTASVRIA